MFLNIRNVLKDIYDTIMSWADKNEDTKNINSLNFMNCTQVSSVYSRVFPILHETDDKYGFFVKYFC